MTLPVYVLDSSVFIEAKKRYYAFDIAPGFWEALLHVASQGHIISRHHVMKEICEKYKGEDDLKIWFRKEFSSYCRPDENDPLVVSEYSRVMTWVHQSGMYRQSAKAAFAKATSADGWVIAYASRHQSVVVTEELNIERKNKVAIPVVCDALGVSCLGTTSLLRQLSIKLTWTPQTDKKAFSG